MTNDEFCNLTKLNNKKRIVLHRIVAILLMYAVILICQMIRFDWWIRYDWACFLVSAGYLFFLGFIGHETHGVSIFRDREQRLLDFADYCEAPYFVNSFKNYYAPIRNGDYVYSNHEYFKFECYSTFIGKDIDFNSLYLTKVYLMDGKKKMYEVARQDYDYSGALVELYRKIKDDGLDIEAIYNQFGDLKWKKCEQHRKRSNQYRLKIYHVIWPIIQFLVAVLPVLFMFYTNITI